jgi:hypothetical protein
MRDNQLANGMWDTKWDVHSGKQINSKCSLMAEVNVAYSNHLLFKITLEWQRGPIVQYNFFFPPLLLLL